MLSGRRMLLRPGRWALVVFFPAIVSCSSSSCIQARPVKMPKPGGAHDPRPGLVRDLLSRSCSEPAELTFPTFTTVRADACGETRELRCWGEPCFAGLTCCQEADGGPALCHVPPYYSRTKRARTVEYSRALAEAPPGSGRCN